MKINRNTVIAVIGLVAIARLPLDKGVQRTALTVAIGLAAVASLARENQAASLARLVAWDQRHRAA